VFESVAILCDFGEIYKCFSVLFTYFLLLFAANLTGIIICETKVILLFVISCVIFVYIS